MAFQAFDHDDVYGQRQLQYPTSNSFYQTPPPFGASSGDNNNLPSNINIGPQLTPRFGTLSMQTPPSQATELSFASPGSHGYVKNEHAYGRPSHKDGITSNNIPDIQMPTTISSSSAGDIARATPRHKLFTLITDKYLYDPTSSAESVAAVIASPLTDQYEMAELIYEANEPAPTIKGHLTLTYSLLLDVAAQIEPHHYYADKLVDLLKALQRLEPPHPATRPDLKFQLFETQWGGQLWKDLLIFGSTVVSDFRDRGAWGKATDAKKPVHCRQFSSRSFAHRSAFLAKLTNAYSLNFLDFAIETLSCALEERLDVKDLNQVLPSAAMWVIHAGRLIYHNGIPQGVDETSDVKGELYHGPGGFGPKRWEHWKSQFATFAHAEQLSHPARGLATRAMETMAHIESVEGEPNRAHSTIACGWSPVACEAARKTVAHLSDEKKNRFVRMHGSLDAARQLIMRTAN